MMKCPLPRRMIAWAFAGLVGLCAGAGGGAAADAYRRLEQGGVFLRYSADAFAGHSVTREPRLTAEENGTDIPFAVAPEHRVITFETKRSVAYLAIIPLEDPSVADYSRAYPEIHQAAAALAAHPSQPREVLDLWTIDGERAITSKVQRLDFPSLSGIAFITRYTQEEQGNPVNNEQLLFVFQGLTRDMKYYIDARFSIAHPSLPPDIDHTGGIVRDKEERYLRQAEHALDAAPDASFTPPLTALKELLASLSIR